MPFIVLLFLFVFLALPSPGKAQECPPFKEPGVTVTPNFRPPELDISLRLSAIRKMAVSGDTEKFSSLRHEVPVGLTSARLKTAISYKIVSSIAHDNRSVCSQIEGLSMTLGFDDTIIYLAKELPVGSCSYKTVLDHELLHVRTDETIARIFSEKFPPLIKKAIREIGIVRTATADEAEEMIGQAMHKYINDLNASLATARQKQQEKIDTKEEYARLSKSCNGKLGEIISRASR